MTSNRRRVLSLLGTAFFMTILDGTSLMAALPAIERDLEPSGPAIQWAVTAYALAFSGLLLLSGRAADMLGRRKVFLAGMVLRMVSSLLCGLAPSLGALAGARALQGISAAIIAPAALSMVVNAFAEGPERNRALGVWGGLGGLGATAGLLLGGVITDTLGWQWIFWINLPVGAAVLLLAPYLLSESHARTRGFDLAGALTVTPALVLLVYVITRVPEAGWDLGPLAAAAGLFALFVVIERRSAAPLLPLRLLRSRTLVGGNLLILAAGMAVDGMLITLTAHVQQVLGWSAALFGLVTAAMTVTSVAGALAGQRVVTRLGVRPVAVAGTLLLGAACLLLTRLPSDGSSGILLIALLVFGAGMGTAAVCAQITALSGVAERDSGLAAGLTDTSFAIGTALGVAICSTVATSAVHDPAAPVLTSAHHAAFATAALFAAAGLLVALTLFGKRLRPAAATSPPAGDAVSRATPHTAKP
ncbi:MFS transporter [Nonomuraea aridisoli]|uniref:MFS transporter n=1 Tax=Nonomuraea aridisoli TaxID=2070368 RepID=A0A2W2EFE9_9ACTN|nr:MFS transporter [Nonomuraea aridisoli]PZG03494.1 MFS transporter [Nonomuraea aridisoli]